MEEEPETTDRTDIKCEWWRHTDGRSQPFGYRIISSANGKTLATPGESYTKRGPMFRMIQKLFGSVDMWPVDPPKGGGE